jgi:hypothetical protein
VNEPARARQRRFVQGAAYVMLPLRGPIHPFAAASAGVLHALDSGGVRGASSPLYAIAGDFQVGVSVPLF